MTVKAEYPRSYSACSTRPLDPVEARAVAYGDYAPPPGTQVFWYEVATD